MMNTMQGNFIFALCIWERERERERGNENNKTMQQTQTRRNGFCEKVAAKNAEVAAKVIH
jgi:hypothetical protein